MTITLGEFLQQLLSNPALLVIATLTAGVILVNGWTDAPTPLPPVSPRSPLVPETPS